MMDVVQVGTIARERCESNPMLQCDIANLKWFKERLGCAAIQFGGHSARGNSENLEYRV